MELSFKYKCGSVMHEEDDLRYDTIVNKMTVMSRDNVMRYLLKTFLGKEE